MSVPGICHMPAGVALGSVQEQSRFPKGRDNRVTGMGRVPELLCEDSKKSPLAG